MNRRPLFPYLLTRGRVGAARARGFHAYGFKLISIQLMDFFNPPDRDFARRLSSSGFVFVHLQRRNLLRQALSVLRAVDSGEWHRRSEADGEAGPRTVEIPTLFFQMRLMEIQNDALRWMIEGLPQTSLWYEDHLAEPHAHQRTVDELCRLLGIEPQPVSAGERKIASARLADDVENLDEVWSHLSGTAYERFLDR